MTDEVLDGPQTDPGGPGRIRALDGMRAIAVLAVMAFHTASSPLAGGYLGVDVFFVLSGFLIGGILVDQQARSGRIGLGAFWLRRARRLAPPLLLLLLVVAITRVVSNQTQTASWRGDILAALTYTTNWFQILTDGDYFAQFGIESPLVHTWSLAIEEQFYLGFALLMALVLPRLRLRSVTALLTLTALFSAGWMILLGSSNPVWAYYSTATRIQSLLIGALLAIAVRRRDRWWSPSPSRARSLVGLVAAVGLLASFLLPLSSDSMFDGGFTVMALLAAAVIWAALAPGPLAVVLAWRPLVALGVISYGVYLWHWPIFLWLGTRREADVAAQFWAMVLTIVVAALSYVLVERPIREGRFTRWEQWRQWTAYAIAAAAIAGMALLPARTAPVDTELTWPAADTVPRRIFGAGDSTMLALGMRFPQERYPETLLWGPAEIGCGIVDEPLWVNGTEVRADKCLSWRDTWRSKLAEHDAEVAVISSWVWDAFDRAIDGEPRAPGTPQFDDAYTEAFKDAARIASDGGRIPVYILGVPCMAAERDQDVLNDPERIRQLNALLQRVVTSLPNARFVDMASLTCAPDGTGIRFRNGRELRDDGVHWTPSGAEEVWVFLLERMITDGVVQRVPAPTMSP